MQNTSLYPNLEAERARRALSYEDLASALGITRITLHKRVKAGGWKAKECTTLCKLFGCTFEYLFKEEKQDEHEQAAGGD